ncbi:MAG: hypothetical protein JXA30_05555 [Deltaproteobacteria bacterium]|nr:hypothetical protein [Deltaproteobacteria bacterium]
MKNENRVWSYIPLLVGVLVLCVFCACSEDNPAAQQGSLTGGTGAAPGGAGVGGIVAGSSDQMAGSGGYVEPVAGAGGSISSGGSGATTIPDTTDGGIIEIMDSGTTDGNGGLGGASGTDSASGSGGVSGSGGASGTGGTGGSDVIAGCEVTAVPDDVRSRYNLDPFYQKYADANGIPIVTSSEPDDQALILACQLVVEMLSERDDVRQALVNGSRWGLTKLALLSKNETISDIPEYQMYGTAYDMRARGLGGLTGLCAEENMLCLSDPVPPFNRADPWAGENICVHEYAHTLSIYGLAVADPTWESRLDELYRAAVAAGRFANTYAGQEPQEYWAEGVQDWYNTNQRPQATVHNEINTREELLEYDPDLYDFIDEFLPQDTKFVPCYRYDE